MESLVVSVRRVACRPLGVVAWLAAVALVASCHGTPIQPAPQPTPMPEVPEGPSLETTEPYRRAGFLVGGGAVPFVGVARFFGTESLDTTMVLVALSIPPRALSFVRAGDRYAAYYAVRLEVVAGQTTVRNERPTGEVRVASVQETRRTDEGVIFQRAFRIAPGTYSLRITTHDSLGGETGSLITPISVPQMGDGSVTPLLPVFAAEPRRARNDPVVAVANPRATLRYGRDPSMPLYFEAYGGRAPDTILITSHSEADSSIVPGVDTVVLPRNAELRSAHPSIPIYSFGLGLNTITARRTDGTPLASTSAIVSIGEQPPVATFGELFDALKYFATDAELRELREASPEKRPARWERLMRESDPNSSTADNEALHEYFRRIAVANAKYREGSKPVWETDRGSVVIALGEPDAISAPVAVDSTGLTHFVTWEYRRHRLLLVFYDEPGYVHWRLTTTSEAEFRSLLNIAGPCVGCR